MEGCAQTASLAGGCTAHAGPPQPHAPRVLAQRPRPHAWDRKLQSGHCRDTGPSCGEAADALLAWAQTPAMHLADAQSWSSERALGCLLMPTPTASQMTMPRDEDASVSAECPCLSVRR
eukprot:359365-Chlamydomonas_euryale.AAC.8